MWRVFALSFTYGRLSPGSSWTSQVSFICRLSLGARSCHNRHLGSVQSRQPARFFAYRLSIACATVARCRSERIPGRLGGEFQVAEVHAETRADAGADRHHDHVVGDRRGHPKAADEVGRAVDADKTFIEGVPRRHVVDQHQGARPPPAESEAEGGALPIDRALANV